MMATSMAHHRLKGRAAAKGFLSLIISPRYRHIMIYVSDVARAIPPNPKAGKPNRPWARIGLAHRLNPRPTKVALSWGLVSPCPIVKKRMDRKTKEAGRPKADQNKKLRARAATSFDCPKASISVSPPRTGIIKHRPRPADKISPCLKTRRAFSGWSAPKDWATNAEIILSSPSDTK